MVMLVHCIEPFYLGGPGTYIASESDAFWVTFINSALRPAVPLFMLASSYLLFPLKPYTATVTITGQEDILLATTDNAGPFNGAAARQGTNPNLAFKHALSQFKFSAINLGSEEIKLSGIKVNTANTGTMTVLPTQSLVAGTDLVDINLVMDELTLVSKSSITDPQKTDYDAVAKSSVQSTVMVFPGSSYDLYFTLTQGTDMSRTLKVTVGDTIESGYAYEFQVKLYSLEKIEITATLADWEDKQISIDTDSAEEV